MTRKRTRGITLFELVVVCFIVLLMASLIESSFGRFKEQQDEREFGQNLRSEATRAHVMAINDGQTVTMQYDAAQAAITLSETPQSTSSTTQIVPLTELQNQTPQTIHTISVPSTVTLAAFKVGTSDTDGSGWKLHFYPDGKSDGGGVQLDIDKDQRSLVIDAHGNASYVTGSIPDTSNDIWQAGQLETRTQ